MRRIIVLLAAGFFSASVLSGCGGASSTGSSAAATPADAASAGLRTPAPAERAGKTAADTAQAYVTAWAAEDAAALEQLLTPGARSSWDMAGGIGKWLLDQRGSYGSPLPDQGRVLAAQESGGTGTADVAVAYRCNDCAEDRLPEWPPAGSTAVAARLTLQRGADDRWLISYLDGSDYLDALTRPTRTVVAAATNTAYAADMAATRTVQGAHAAATATARTVGAVATRTAMTVSLNTTATALWEQWFPQSTRTPLPVATK